jgi:hypothetical protein
MKNKPVTIDSLDISVHKRYAIDQESLDTVYIHEPQLIAPHSKITGTSSIYSSKWEELLEVHKRSTTWANFEPPHGYFHQSNRFFSHCLLPDLYTGIHQDQKENEEALVSIGEIFAEKKQKKISKQELFDLISLEKSSDPLYALGVENDKKNIVSLLESIEKINKMLSDIHARKLQFQKG